MEFKPWELFTSVMKNGPWTNGINLLKKMSTIRSMDGKIRLTCVHSDLATIAKYGPEKAWAKDQSPWEWKWRLLVVQVTFLFYIITQEMWTSLISNAFTLKNLMNKMTYITKSWRCLVLFPIEIMSSNFTWKDFQMETCTLRWTPPSTHQGLSDPAGFECIKIVDVTSRKEKRQMFGTSRRSLILIISETSQVNLSIRDMVKALKKKLQLCTRWCKLGLIESNEYMLK